MEWSYYALMGQHMTVSKESKSEQVLGLHWLIRLRWIAVHGLIVISLVSTVFFGIVLPVSILVGCLGFSALSNVLLRWHARRSGGSEWWLMPLVLGIDIVALTIMLYFAGGAHNPFTMFYLLHMTMAIILLPTWGAWGAVALCTLGFWCLFRSDHELVSRYGGTCCNDMSAHLKGMAVGMFLTGSGIAYFVIRLTAALNTSRMMTERAQSDGEQARRTMEVATLAASIAHELATPLSTIAVVSQDLETTAGECCASRACAADAGVIRQEVERCRLIIEKLGMAGRMEKEDIKPLDWDQLGDLLSRYLAAPLRERLDLKLRPSPIRPLLSQSRLFQCLAILIKNAAEAAPAWTPIILDAEIYANSCIFRVIDRGPGFPEELKSRIGEPLVTTKSKSGGLGLGLYLVKTFVAERGGDLRLETGPEGETVLVMRVPFKEAKST